MKRYYITLTLLMLITITGGQYAFAQDAPAVELQVETEQPLTEYNLEDAVVTLTLTGKTYVAQVVPQVITVSGVVGVSLSDVTRESDTVLKVTLAYPLIDFDADTELTFSVRAVAIADYNGAPLTAKIPVIGVKESLSALPVAPLTEANLGAGVVRLILEGGTWRSLSDIRYKVTVSGIDGVTIQKQSYRYCASGWICFGNGNRTGYRPAVRRVNNTVLEVPLAFDKTDFDTDATLTFTVEADALENYKGAKLTAEIPVTAVREIDFSASVASPLTEATLDGSIVTLLLTAVDFEQDISTIRDAVLVSGINGVTIDTATVQRLSDRKITVELDYDGTDFIRDTALTFTLTSKAIANHNGELTTEIPVTANSNEDVLTIYWTDSGTDKIQRATVEQAIRSNLDPSDVEDLVTQGLEGTKDIALDVAGGKMYWTDFDTDKIQRANLDGSNVEDLITQGLEGPLGIALDVVGGKMYWTDFDTDKIQRANLDGSNVEDLITQGYIHGPRSIALDIASGKMYWIDLQINKIQRANLDGSNVEDLITRGLVTPLGIALDVVSGKMYWTDRGDWKDIGTGKIQRANLDGSNVENLITQGLDDPDGIALDVANGKLYWTDWGTDKIQRANLDGSDVEDLVTQGLRFPGGIAIAMSSLVNPTTEEPTIAKEDVNRDGVVDVNDLVIVAQRYGKTGTNAADVNGDKVVNVDDFILVAAAVDSAVAAAPAARAQVRSHFTKAQLQGWLTEARASGRTSRTYQRGIAVVEQLLALFTPVETALLANYPNPFNPETWIPYQLSKSAEVTLTIYAVDGHVVRTLALGHQTAGMYQSRSRAAYWDGRNAVGEPVASGLYFYTLTAGDFSATRKMLIRK